VMIFNARTHPDWEPYIGERLDWQQRYTNADQLSKGGQLRIRRADTNVQEDSLRLIFSGDGSQLNQWYWQSQVPKDLSGALQEESALNFTIVVNTYPSEEATVRMDCLYPCSAAISITDALNALPKGVSSQLAIPIQCFVESGLRIDRVDTPALLVTTGALDVTLSAVNIGVASDASIKVSCD
jgi:beta-glucosidase